MALTKIDAAGAEKLKTLDDTLRDVQHLHGIVERFALAVKTQQPTATHLAQFKRSASPLVGRLKGQFGLLSDHVAAILLHATRGGGDLAKVRTLRDGVAQLRTQLELTMTKVREKHSVAVGDEP